MWAKTDFNLVELNMAHWVTASLRDQMASSVYLWVFINSDSNKWVIEAKATSQGRQVLVRAACCIYLGRLQLSCDIRWVAVALV